MITRNIRLIVVLIFIMFGAVLTSAYAASTAKVTIKVLDEGNKPVETAHVRLYFQGGALKKDAITGVTNSEGVFSASGLSADGVVGGGVSKEGYYNSSYSNNFITRNVGMWQPWNKEIKVVLRPKIKPVPMYMRHKWVTIPVAGKEVGFDLMKFDWVAPHGLGSKADFVFFLESSYKSFDEREAKLTITFSNKYDGIQPFELDMGGDFGDGSRFRSPRYAPENGYLERLNTRYTPNSPEAHVYKTKDPYYFFRVRSEVDENGKLRCAMYGKLKGSLKADARKNGLAEIELFYWLNPDYTRNMEFDIDRNLFNSLPEGQGTRLP